MPASYRSIDHLMLRLHAAEPLFELFSETFGLPVAWPLQRADFATYGWVHLGNTALELWAAATNGDLPEHAQPPLIHGFAWSQLRHWPRVWSTPRRRASPASLPAHSSHRTAGANS